jgi:hypothetical protein
MRTIGRYALLTAALGLGLGSAAIAKPKKTTVAEVPAIANAATIMAYKRDPLPIYDDTGSKLRDVPQKEMPKAQSAAARVVKTKPGFVAIMLAGKPAWLRLTTVDYVGDLPTPPCDKVAMQLALNEEDGVERSLGLGCSKPTTK